MMTDTKPQPHFMHEALADARAALPRAEGGPFGACIVRNGAVVARAHNTVLAEHDSTCHAEINAIRAASRALGTHDLSGCTIYSTTEPCPMCFAAIHWARIDAVVFGTRIEDVNALGFNELTISNQQLAQQGRSPVRIVADFLRDECLGLLKEWRAGTAVVY